MLILVILTGGYIIKFEKSNAELAAYRAIDSQAIRFSSDSLSTIAVEKDGVDFTVIREDGNWSLSKPVEAKVAPEKMDQMVSQIAMLKRMDVVPVKTDEAKKEYGFDEPRARLTLSDNQGEKTWLIGRDTPVGDTMLYIMEEGAQEAVVANSIILKVLPSNIDDIRDRKIFTENNSAISRIDIRRPSGFLQLVMDASGRWKIQQPGISMARQNVISDILNFTLNIPIKTFIADEVTDLTSYGLKDPQAQIMIASGEESGVGLLIGNPVPDDPTLLYAKQSEEFTIFTVSADVLPVLQIDANLLRDPRILPMDTANIKQIDISHPNDDKLVLVRDENKMWNLAEPRRWPVDETVFKSFLDIWQNAVVKEFIVKNQEFSQLGELAATLNFYGENNSEGFDINFYEPKSENEPALFTRVGEDILFAYDSSFLTNLNLTPLNLKNRTLTSIPEKQISKISQVFDYGTAIVERNEVGEFVGANPESLAKFLDTLKDLPAEYYVEENPESLAEFGLDFQRCRITISFNEGNEIGQVLLIGNDTENGTYMMLQGSGIVSIIKKELAEILCTDLTKTEVEDTK